MTIQEWAEQQTGRVITIPEGTVLGHDWFYFENGKWTRKPSAWVPDMPKEWRAVTTTRDTRVEIRLDAGALVSHAHKAVMSRAGKSRDGALTLKRA